MYNIYLVEIYYLGGCGMVYNTHIIYEVVTSLTGFNSYTRSP